jgi:hypothetical protein
MNRAKAKTVLIVTCSIALQHELMCALAATVPSCSGFTIDQIGGIMGAYAAPVRDVATSLPLLVWMHLDIKRGLLFFRQPPLKSVDSRIYDGDFFVDLRDGPAEVVVGDSSLEIEDQSLTVRAKVFQGTSIV